MSDDRAPVPFEAIAPQLVPGAVGAFMSVYDVTFPNGSVGSQQYLTLEEARRALTGFGD